MVQREGYLAMKGEPGAGPGLQRIIAGELAEIEEMMSRLHEMKGYPEQTEQEFAGEGA